MSSGISRRAVLQTAAVSTAVAATGVSLSACSSSGTTGGDIGSAGKDLAPFPAHVPTDKAPVADLPATDSGVQAGYLKYPGELTESVPEKPGDGSKISAWITSWGATPLPKDGNKYWQAIEAALGVELDITVVPAAEYSKKLTALMASGQMPDILQMVPTPNEAQFVAAKCQDMTEFISGDAIKKYPNLANIPPYAWKAAGRFAGKLYGIPVERPVAGHGHIVNQEKCKEAGLLVPEVGGMGVEEFTKGLQQISGRGKWALGAEKAGAFGFNAWIANFGSPNVWSVKDGAFLNYIETDEFQAGLEQMTKWYKSGVTRVNPLTLDGATAKTEFFGKKVFSVVNSTIGFRGAVIENKGAFTVDYTLPFKPSNGATPKHWLGSGMYGYTVLKQAPKARIELILRVMNYLAAPFGTKEWELVNYGQEGTHFTRGKDGGPVKTDLALSGSGGADQLPVYYIAAAPQPLYIPDHPDATRRQYAWQQKVVPIGEASAHYGLRANAWAQAEEALMQQREDAIKDVVTGRKSLSDWADVVKEFKRKGGDKAADALAKEHEAAGKV
ncbi:extracellular solute-binding protein [Streptomyces sp. FIT100]|uniref:extracellular solute-binding protein n=1 Tax=Streptomyces sp. FIT100 TaxID=2837956 RepID=UPI0021C93A62|nr:extracellular solute-binding protein [Streptomyces sp. FIT100]UUN30102.1 extracellular solute-binding protein [Streptomyces sp. FIT100]